MAVERPEQIERLYRDALARPPAERLAFVAESTRGDAELRHAVEARLSGSEATAMAQPPPGVAVGTTIGHYRIEGIIASGGMGIVCRGTDLNLARPVAIKFLSEHLLDANARRRFQQEARMASALNHPHILTVYDAGELDGRQYLVTEFVDGGTFADWRASAMQRGWRQCVELLIGVADGLAAAHEANILHRDIKPANILLTGSGYAKLADFGLAKPADERRSANLSATRTAAGAVLGTIAYMSPEQAAGQKLDPRSDIFSFGVVLFEALTGRRPFTAATDLELLQMIIHAPPAPLDADLPQALRTIVEKAIEKDPADRYQTMRDFVVDLRRVVRASAQHRDHSLDESKLVTSVPQAPPQRRGRAPWRAVGVAVAAIALVAAGAWFWQRTSAATQARTEAIPAIAALVEAGDYTAAFERAQDVVEYVSDDPLLNSLKPQFTMTFSVTTSPPDAEVFVRGYEAADDAWQSLGRTPLAAIEMPRRVLRWRFEKSGFETVERVTRSTEDRVSPSLQITLAAVGAQPPEMVAVPAGDTEGNISGLPLPTVAVPEFLIDRTEVTNRAFKEFIEAGGYERQTYWEGLTFADETGRSQTFEEAIARFVDSTGRVGPATWELGDYPRGQDEFPVTGVSWYEAAAYARFRGKTLPSVLHWARATLPRLELASSLAASVLPLSNFSSAGPRAVRAREAVGPYGTYDMYGNAREWLSNTRAEGGWLIGGDWQDPEYSYVTAVSAKLIERSELNGFRLMRAVGSAATLSNEGIDLSRPRRTATVPVSDEVFAGFADRFAYRRGDLNATEPVTLEEADDWIKQRVTIDAGYNGERLDVLLFIPRNYAPPYQPLLYFPGIDAVFLRQSSESIQPGFAAVPLDFLVRSGRAFVQPIYQGTYERFRAPWNAADQVRNEREWVERRWDLGRALDYLETRADIDATRVGYVGVSFGASTALPIVAVEPRLSTALLLSGGMPHQGQAPTPFVDPIHYTPRITIPALMVNGRFDYIFPLESQQLLFDTLGAPEADKRYALFDYGHGSPPRAELLRETLSWLDRYLGRPVPR
jgi:formylglycine-generating enzyme required for sulfatase activity/dienelactone hydrolase